MQSCTQQQDRERKPALSLPHRLPGMSCALGSSLALAQSICGLCGHPEGPQCPQAAPRAAGCQLLCVLLLQTIPSCRILSSFSSASLSGLLSDIVFEFPGSESPAAHGHGHPPGCYNTRKHFPWLIKGQGGTELSCIPSQCVRNRVPALPATLFSSWKVLMEGSHMHMQITSAIHFTPLFLQNCNSTNREFG